MMQAVGAEVSGGSNVIQGCLAGASVLAGCVLSLGACTKLKMPQHPPWAGQHRIRRWGLLLKQPVPAEIGAPVKCVGVGIPPRFLEDLGVGEYRARTFMGSTTQTSRWETWYLQDTPPPTQLTSQIY